MKKDEIIERINKELPEGVILKNLKRAPSDPDDALALKGLKYEGFPGDEKNQSIDFNILYDIICKLLGKVSIYLPARYIKMDTGILDRNSKAILPFEMFKEDDERFKYDIVDEKKECYENARASWKTDNYNINLEINHFPRSGFSTTYLFVREKNNN